MVIEPNDEINVKKFISQLREKNSGINISCISDDPEELLLADVGFASQNDQELLKDSASIILQQND